VKGPMQFFYKNNVSMHQFHYEKFCPFQPYVSWVLMWLVPKSTEFVTTIVVVLYVLELQTLLVINVTKFWHLLLCSCNCDYLLQLLCISNEKVDEKWIHVNSTIDHIQWQTSCFNTCNMCYWICISISN